MNGQQTTPATLRTAGAGWASRVLAPAVSFVFTWAVHGSAVAQPSSEPTAAPAASAQAPKPAADDRAAAESVGPEHAEDQNAAASPAQQPVYQKEALDSDALANMSLQELLQVQVVEAASRRKQTMHDAPSSVTVLDRGQIEQTGAVDVAELMRRVPGAHVVRQTNNAYDVALRNQTYQLGNRVLVLLDGRPVTDPLFGLAPYPYLSVGPMELERVEVVRGPGSTLYGADAAGGVVRLQTRRPLDHPGFEGDVSTGMAYLPKDSPSGENRSLTNAAYGHVGYNYANEARTFGMRGVVGAGLAPEAGTVPVRSTDLGQSRYHASLHFDYRPDADTTAYAAFSQSHHEAVNINTTDVSYPLVRFDEQAAVANFERRNLLGGHVTTRAVLDATRAVAVSNTRNRSRGYHGLWLNDLALFDSRSITTLGAETSYTHGNTTDVSPKAIAYSLIAQEDLALLSSRALVLSGAGRFESILYSDGLGNEIIFRNANPRLSLISKMGDHHDVHLTAASAYRLPSALEVSSGYRYPSAPREPPLRVVVPNTALKPEQTQSVELGYRGDLWERLRLEIVTYTQKVHNVVNIVSPHGLPFVFENAPVVSQVGLETAAAALLSSELSIYAHFAARRTRQEGKPMREWPGYILGFGTDNTFRRSVRVHGDVSFVFDFDTQGMDVLPGTPLVTISRIDVPDQIDVNLRVGKLLWDGRAEVYALGRNLAAFVRDREDLVQFPPYPVGATLLVGLGLFES